MDRRAFLRAGAAATAVGLAGCTSAALSGGDGTETTSDGNQTPDGQTEQTVTTEVVGPPERTGLADVTFTVEREQCGTETNVATISRDEDSHRVVVRGTITVPSACYTAEPGDAAVLSAQDALWLPVRRLRKPDVDVCTQCLTEVDYRMVATVDGPIPRTVVVTHGGEVVCDPRDAAGGKHSTADGTTTTGNVSAVTTAEPTETTAETTSTSQSGTGQ